MFKTDFRHLHALKRTRIVEPANVVMRLQRLERPEPWPKDLIDRAFGDIPRDILQRYPNSAPFYAKLGNFLGVDPANIVLTSGIDEAIRSLIALTCDAGDTIAAVIPGYAMYEVYADVFWVRLAPIRFSPTRFTPWREMMDQVPEGAKVLFLSNPSQPVENCFDLTALSAIAAACAEREILLAVDEAYHFFGAPSAIPLIRDFPGILVMRTFSKAFGAASIRLGYVVGAPEALAPLANYRLAHEANALSMHVAGVLLDCFDTHIAPGIRDVCEGRDFLKTAARAAGLNTWGEVANFVLIELKSPEQTRDCVTGLNQDGIYVKSGFLAPLDHHLLVGCGSKRLMETFFARLMEKL